jgi:thioredoxin 1
LLLDKIKGIITYVNSKKERTMSILIKTVSDESFGSDVLKSTLPVLVDFWAEWCGPCKMLAPVLEEVAGQFQGKVVIAKVNVDQNENTPAQYGIRGIPTLLLFKNGEVAATKVGALSKGQLTEFLNSHLK